VLEELVKADPMPGLIKVQDEIRTIVGRHIAEESWPWPGPKPSIGDQVNARVDELCHEYGGNWTPPPAGKVV
jgi:hypothetical protein